MGRLHACAKSLCIVVFILTMPSLFSQQTGTGNEVIRHIPQSDSALVALIDSLEREHYLKAERVFNEEMAEGWMPAGFVSVQLGRLINYNHYEGFKPGVGLRTNAFLLNSSVQVVFIQEAFAQKTTTTELSFDSTWKLQDHPTLTWLFKKT